MSNLRIDADRLWDSLLETAKIGATPKGGICRLTLTDLDRQVRDWFRAQAEAIGCAIIVDDMGVMFARRAGLRSDIAPIAMGSHLDTQPTGGKFDGALGVLAALETMRTLVMAGYETFAPIEVINWTNEEGARFTPAMLASGVFAGVFSRDWAASRQDRTGITFDEALKNIGSRGEQRCGDHPLSAFFELHIEQGPNLEAEGKDIGVVIGVQAMRWYEVIVVGEEAHAGTTPMPRRKDALVVASRLVERVNQLACEKPPSAVATVGSLEVQPNSPNVVPGRVVFTVDLRHPDETVISSLEASLYAIIDEIRRSQDLQIETKKIWHQPPIRFDATCVTAVREAARACALSYREIVSGAGHDAAYVASVAPTAMIFVPCRAGLSHNEAEFTSKEQCAIGAQVLLRTVLNFDRELARQHGTTGEMTAYRAGTNGREASNSSLGPQIK